LLLRVLYERVGRPVQAIPVLEAAVRADPRQLVFVLGLSEVYVSLGRYDDALGLTSEVLARQPDLTAARLLRGQAYVAKGDTAGALRDFEEAVRSSSQSAPAHLYLARVLVRLGRREDAQAEYRHAIKLEPRLALAKRELATLRGEKQDEQSQAEEINQIRAVISNDPRNVVARESLARVYFERGQMKEAEGALKQVLEMAPTLAEPNYLMARILLGQNKEEEAAGYLRAALRSNPSHVGSNVLLGRYLFSKGQPEQARRPLELALSVNPNLAEAKLLLVNVYAQSGRFSDALGLAQDLHRADPKAAGPLVLIGALQLGEQNPRAAIDAFEKSLKLNAHSVEAHRGLGQAYSLLGEHDRAEASYREVLKIEGNDVVSLNNLAWILVEVRGKPDQALPLAEKAQRLVPNAGGVIDTLGWIHYRRESYGEAEKLLLQAADRAPSNGLVQFHLGMTYLKLGRKNDAVSAFRRAVKLDPKLADREKIGQVIKELES
ncbi:MAG TPA: tetratricopeptide repeat protein, partial [Methylomirabilota bacterium]